MSRTEFPPNGASFPPSAHPPPHRVVTHFDLPLTTGSASGRSRTTSSTVQRRSVTPAA